MNSDLQISERSTQGGLPGKHGEDFSSTPLPFSPELERKPSHGRGASRLTEIPQNHNEFQTFSLPSDTHEESLTKEVILWMR